MAECEFGGMSKHMTAQQLAEQIEELVSAYLAEGRAAAAAAVARAFAGAPGGADTKPGRVRAVPRRAQAARRPPEQMERLAERLYEAVCAKPGESMTALAAIVGSTPRELHVPAGRLKRAGRLRSVGQRQFARYFPMAKASRAG